jgi:hypothetical protein
MTLRQVFYQLEMAAIVPKPGIPDLGRLFLSVLIHDRHAVWNDVQESRALSIASELAGVAGQYLARDLRDRPLKAIESLLRREISHVSLPRSARRGGET